MLIIIGTSGGKDQWYYTRAEFAFQSNLVYFIYMRRFIHIILIVIFLFPKQGFAQEYPKTLLPPPGTLVNTSTAYSAPVLKGIKTYPNAPFRIDFIVDTGDSDPTKKDTKEEYTRIIKYFLAALTIPEQDLWVNLSPHEQDRLIPTAFGRTEMGRDLLAQDYLLKHLTASLVHPDTSAGQSFWNDIFAQATALLGTTDIPLDTFNKVWIVPTPANIYTHNGLAIITQNSLHVMAEEDYLAQKNNPGTNPAQTLTQNFSTSAFKNEILPFIEQEVNNGKNFARLRQIHTAVILALWYKRHLRDSILNHNYANQDKTLGLEIPDINEKQRIYQNYLESFRKGIVNLIREEEQSPDQPPIPRHYFSGGAVFSHQELKTASLTDAAQNIDSTKTTVISVQLEDPSDEDRDAIGRSQIEAIIAEIPSMSLQNSGSIILPTGELWAEYRNFSVLFSQKLAEITSNNAKETQLNLRLEFGILHGLYNAVIHGNNGDENKNIELKWSVLNDTITLQIIDQGTEPINDLNNRYVYHSGEIISGMGEAIDHMQSIYDSVALTPIIDTMGQKTGGLLTLKYKFDAAQKSLPIDTQDPLTNLREKGSARVVLFDLDNTLAQKSGDSEEYSIPIETQILIQQALLIGIEIGILTTRSLETVQTRINEKDLLMPLPDHAKDLWHIYERFGLRYLNTLIKDRLKIFSLTQQNLLPILENVIQELNLVSPTSRFEKTPDSTRNPDFDIYSREEITLQTQKENIQNAGAFAVLTFYGLVTPDNDPRPHIAERLRTALPDIVAITIGGTGSINLSLVTKADLVREEYLAKGYNPEEIIVVDDEGSRWGTGFTMLKLAEEGVTAILVNTNTKDDHLPTSVLRPPNPSIETAQDILKIEIGKRKAPSTVKQPTTDADKNTGGIDLRPKTFTDAEKPSNLITINPDDNTINMAIKGLTPVILKISHGSDYPNLLNFHTTDPIAP